MDNPTQYCEWLLNGEHQLLNVITSLAYFVSAYLLFLLVKKTNVPSKLLQATPFALALIGTGSVVWHYNSSAWGDALDTISIVILAFLLCAELLRRVTGKIIFQFVGVGLVAGIGFWLERLTYLNGSLVYLFLFMLLASVGYWLARRQQINVKPFGVGVLLLSIGFVSRVYDPVLCEHIGVGTHFLWHMLVAAALYLVVKSLVTSQTI